MGKASQPAWVKHIFQLLEQAKKKDEEFMIFGSDSHQYKLASPASEKAIQAFELRYGIPMQESCRSAVKDAHL